MHIKLEKSFYQKPALEIVKNFLGKYIVYNSPKGKVSGMIIDVEAYPAKADNVSHGNKRTARTEVMYKEGGYAYIYLIYGMHHQFSAVVNGTGIPEVIFIRAVIPDQGIEIMKENFGREVKNLNDLTKSPGNFCKAFGLTKQIYGEDLCKDLIWLEDRGVIVEDDKILTDKRVGISSNLSGHDLKYRYYIKPNGNKAKHSYG